MFKPPTIIDEALEKERKRLVRAFKNLLPSEVYWVDYKTWRKKTLLELDKLLYLKK